MEGQNKYFPRGHEIINIQKTAFDELISLVKQLLSELSPDVELQDQKRIKAISIKIKGLLKETGWDW